MTTYLFHYRRYEKTPTGVKDMGDCTQAFSASSNKEARIKVRRFMKDFNDNISPDMSYELLQIMKVI
jgi:hypothetical protein